MNGWKVLVRREIECWGTVITVDVPAAAGERARVEASVDAVMPTLLQATERIDRIFSTWRQDSLATQLRLGLIDEGDLATLGADGVEMLRVLVACRRAGEISCGAFDPWKAPGGFDPSGYVKGWGAGVLADLVASAGLPDVCVNAAGDLATRGVGPTGAPWRVGIAHPEDPHSLCAALWSAPEGDIEGRAGAVATSGYSEQQGHISSRGGQVSATAAVQASVVGPDSGLADALSTALLVDGADGAQWFDEFARADLRVGRIVPRWGALVVQDGSTWAMGCLA